MDLLIYIKSIFYLVGHLGFVLLFLTTAFHLVVYFPSWILFSKIIGETKLRFILRNLQYILLSMAAAYVALGQIALIPLLPSLLVWINVGFCIAALYYKTKRVFNRATLNFEYRDETKQLRLMKKDKYFMGLSALIFIFISFGGGFNLPFIYNQPLDYFNQLFYFAGIFSSTIVSLIGWVYFYGMFEKLWDMLSSLFMRKGAIA